MTTATATRSDDKSTAPGRDDERLAAPARVGDKTAAEQPAPDAAAEKELHLTVIEADHPWWPIVNFAELWRHRDMLYSLTMREIMRRYKQTAFSAVWAILPILGSTAVVGFAFGKLVSGLTEGLAPPLYFFTGLLPWFLFLNILMGTAHSVINHPDLITKIYFPRLILPLAAVGDRVLDFIIGLGVLLLFLAYYERMPGNDVIFLLPVTFVGLIVAGMGVGLLMGAAGVAYRDVFHALGLLTQIWFFATPSIFYSKTAFPEWVRPWLPLNPVYGLIENFRAGMTGGPPDFAALGISLAVSVVLFAIGLVYFQRKERHFCDVI